MDDTAPQLETAPTETHPDLGTLYFENMWGNLPNTRWRNTGRMFQLKIIDDSTTLTTGETKLVFMIPPELDGAKLIKASAFVSTVSSSGLPSIGVRNITQSKEMLISPGATITIDANENTSVTAATAVVIDSSITNRSGDLIAIDVDTAGTGAKGLGVSLSFQ